MRAERIARSGRRAPRYCPVNVLAATEKAEIVRNAIASQRIATPWAAVATAPRRLINRRNQSWQTTLVRLSPAAGRLTRRSLPIRARVGREALARDPQAGSAADHQAQDDRPADPLAAGRADGDPGQPQGRDRAPAEGQQPGQADIHHVHQDHHLHPGPGVAGPSQTGIANGRARQQGGDGADDPEEARGRLGGQSCQVHARDDPRREDLHEHQGEDAECEAHGEGLAAESVRVVEARPAPIDRETSAVPPMEPTVNSVPRNQSR